MSKIPDTIPVVIEDNFESTAFAKSVDVVAVLGIRHVFNLCSTFHLILLLFINLLGNLGMVMKLQVALQVEATSLLILSFSCNGFFFFFCISLAKTLADIRLGLWLIALRAADTVSPIELITRLLYLRNGPRSLELPSD